MRTNVPSVNYGKWHSQKFGARENRISGTTASMLLVFFVVVPLVSAVFVQPSCTTPIHLMQSRPCYGGLVLMAKKKSKKSSARASYNDDDRDRILRDLAKRDGDRIIEESDATPGKLSSGEPTRTLSGGPSLIFSMARRMLVWDDELYQGLNDASRDDEDERAILATALSNDSITAPRWRPSTVLQKSISNVNPAFRTSSPIMTSAGYAAILRRNSRKKMKPSMWKHSLRVYEKMAQLEKIKIDGKSENKKRAIRRKTVHHEAALVAASKLGMWEEAINIYRNVEELPLMQTRKAPKAVVGIGDGTVVTPTKKTNIEKTSAITDNMILSVISACVKGSKVKRTVSLITNPAINETSSVNNTKTGTMMRLLSIEERRRPLDEVRDILLSIEKKHDIPLVSHHVNPLAAAYIRIGLRSDAADLINLLQDRSPSPLPVLEKDRLEPIAAYDSGEESNEDEYLEENDDEFTAGYDETQLNVHQVQAKDRASYALLVQGAVMEDDWVGAVEELKQMTEVGFHPNSRNLSSWAEAVTERSCRPSRNNINPATYSRRGRKRRDRMWLDNWQQ